MSAGVELSEEELREIAEEARDPQLRQMYPPRPARTKAYCSGCKGTACLWTAKQVGQ
jgi:hypothetical protein